MQLAEQIRYLMLAVQREGNRYFNDALRPLDLTAAQAEVLRVLQEYQPISLGELGNLLVCEHGSPSRLVNGLVTMGLVERVTSKRDGRYVTLTLTELGKERAEVVVQIEAKMDEQIMELIEHASIEPLLEVFWRYIEDRPSGLALARRTKWHVPHRDAAHKEASHAD
ncbi:MAG: winged helix DNA-binding protein [Ktedonobacterales bacterium]|nr:winged helix DNA-binding protein [Ktedonobacteraceae bacterium]MBA3823560.1 winged helix DNA-binding protein [Ktedonobacterales bacterium]